MHNVHLPPDPEGMNDLRAGRARAALHAFAAVCATDWEDALSDLLCDLMHLSDRDPAFDFSESLARAEAHYEAETAVQAS